MNDNSKKLSVAFLFDDTLDSTDGVSQYLRILGPWLSSQGHRVSYLVGETKMQEWQGGKVYSLSKNVNVVFNGNRLSMPGVSNKGQIKELLNREKFDVIHVQMPYSPLMAARVIKHAPSTTAIVGTFHIFPANFVARFGSRLLAIVLRPSLKKIDQVVSVSSAAQEFASNVFKIKSEVLPNTINTQLFISNVKNRPNTIVFLGRLVDRKGSYELLQAFNLLVHKMPDAKLIIGGKGHLEAKLKKYVKENALENSVSFSGFVSEEDKADFLAQAAIACFPALYGESFGLVLIEAMAAGSGVVVGGDNPGYQSVLGEKPELLIDPRKTEDFAAHLEKLLSNNELADELHNWQIKEVKRYDTAAVGRELVSIYRSIIAMKNKNLHNNNNGNE